MKILLTNDDGWDAPGLKVLQTSAANFGEIWIVAPAGPMSGISHQVTFERPLTLTPTAERAYSLDGTPADCVRIGTTQLGISFDWVLSGINNGGNLGADIFVSGTVAAAREATLRGVRSIALSQHRNKFKSEFDWTRTGWMTEQVLRRLLVPGTHWEPRTVVNVNLPDRFHSSASDQDSATNLSQHQFLQQLSLLECVQDGHPLPADFLIDDEGRYLYCSKYSERPRMVGRDIAVCFGGAVAITLLRF